MINQLGRRLADRQHWPDSQQDLLQEVLEPAGLSYAEFAAQGVLVGESGFFKYKDQGFPTPSGKVELSLSKAKKLGVPGLPLPGSREDVDGDFPLLLSTAKSSYFLHSSHRWVQDLRQRHPEPLARMHPDTAKEHQLQEQSWISIQTPQGEITQKACLDPDVLPGVVLADSGWWFPEAGQQELYAWQACNYNILTSAKHLGAEFGTPNIRGIKCRIKSVDSSSS
jgi:anaerobic selenocysteine-containing dehydrogenase